jgi:hypothetical protein
MVMLPVPAALATAEPEKLAKIMLATSSTIPIPPRTWPTSVWVKSTRRREIPPAVINSPTSTKKGIAVSAKESAPANICCGMAVSDVAGMNRIM